MKSRTKIFPKGAKPARKSKFGKLGRVLAAGLIVASFMTGCKEVKKPVVKKEAKVKVDEKNACKCKRGWAFLSVAGIEHIIGGHAMIE